MEERRRRRLSWETKYTVKFMYLAFVYIAILVIVNFYFSLRLVIELQRGFGYSSAWKINFVIMQVSFIGVIFTLLVSMFVLLHRSLGPLCRIETVLDKVLQGDYSLRISLRNKDVIHSFATRLNQLIELAGKKK